MKKLVRVVLDILIGINFISITITGMILDCLFDFPWGMILIFVTLLIVELSIGIPCIVSEEARIKNEKETDNFDHT